MYLANIEKNKADDRPINPRKNVQYGGIIDLDFVPDNTKKQSSKHFLKKKKVYDPAEAIKNAKATKTKVNRDHSPIKFPESDYERVVKVSKSPGTMGSSKTPKITKIKLQNVDEHTPTNNFAKMNKQQRVKKISELLRQNRPY
jgi:hypothetical protein